MHRDIEFHYVFAGEESYILGETEYPLKPGHLVCVNSYAPHNYRSLTLVRAVTIIVSVDFLMKNGLDVTKIHFNECIEDSNIGDLLSEIVEELSVGDSAHGIKMNALILSLAAYIARNHACAEMKNEAPAAPQMLRSTYQYVFSAIDYISLNFTNNITLDELSELCKISKYHFLRIFKQITSYTPGEYINRVRSSYAKQLLLNGASVTEAAIASGFSDVHYFSNCFKKYNGCRPSEIGKSRF